MIRLSDALVLATTKLRTRKTRTIITAVMASLVFALIVAAFSLQRGVIDSYKAFTTNSLSDTYIASLYFMPGDQTNETMSPEIIATAKTKNDELIAQKVAEARRLGIDYDPKSEPPVVEKDTYSDAEFLNVQNPAAQKLLAERRSGESSPLEKAKAISEKYNPSALYEFRSFGDNSGLVVMENGRENLSLDEKESKRTVDMMYEPGSITSMSYLPLSLAEPFIFSDADRSVARSVGDEIPVIVPYSQAEKALGLAALPAAATNSEKVARLDDVKRRAVNINIDVCYRNSPSLELIETAKQQLRAQKINAATQEQERILYDLPSENSCGAAVVKQDRRSEQERQYDEKIQSFNRKFAIETEPFQRKITYRIVGISADVPDWGNMGTFESIVLTIGSTTLQGQWIVPDTLVDPAVQESIIPGDSSLNEPWWGGMGTDTLVQFESADSVREFVKNEGCNGWEMCDDKPYISYFGSNSVLIDDITNSVVGVMKWVVLAAAAIAVVLMSGMAGRVITDSRRETAVFRAIGAKRSDIWLVYVLYILMFSALVGTIAIALGLAIVMGLSMWQSESMTTVARLMFIESEYTGAYTLAGVWPLAFLAVAGVIIATGVVAVHVPLLRNLVRSPLRDMRDE